MQRNRKLLAPAAVAVGLATLAACSSNASTSGSGSGSGSGSSKIAIAGVVGGTSDPFWASLGCGAKAEAGKLGVTLKTYEDTSLDTAKFSSNFQSALLTSPQGVFVTLAVPNQLIAQFKTEMTKGVPVVTGAATSPAAQYKVVFSDPATQPYIADALATLPKDAGSMVVLGGAPGIPPLENRWKPFVAGVLAANTGLKQLPVVYSGFDVNKATSSVASLLISHPDLKVIVAATGPDGLGAAAAIKNAHKEGKVALVAFDAVPGEVAALKDGTISALIAQSPAQIGTKQVDALVDYIKEKKSGAVPASSDFTGIPQKVLTKANVDDPANADYIYKTSC
jgi:ribose transport system substrate-binding protein